MMDHYEELGVDRSASPEEIREAYKRLVRLLHPDRCADEQLRPMAELQMKRLNEVLRVLTNPQERTRYDRQAAIGPHLERPSIARAESHIRKHYPIAVAVLLLALIPALLRQMQRPTLSVADRDPVADARNDVSKDAPSGRPPGPLARPQAARKVVAEPDSGWIPAEGAPPVISPLPNPVTWSESDVAPKDEVPVPPVTPIPEVRSVPRPSLAGEWFFLQPAQSRTNGFYPPEFIELRVTETSGLLHGRYRARYHVADQAISPTVAFQFEGRGDAGEAKLPWRGAGGARGEIRLRLASPGTLEVSWMAQQLGEEMGLISGTAVLTRKIE